MERPPSISPEDWAATPPAVQALVWAQAEEIRLLRAQVQALQEEVQRLRQEVATLRKQLGQNSRNSSRPPSSDPPGAPPASRSSSGRKPGGQRGHAGISRRLKPLAEVTAEVTNNTTKVPPTKPISLYRLSNNSCISSLPSLWVRNKFSLVPDP